jgi:uncharacterized protein with FMN-binding domain
MSDNKSNKLLAGFAMLILIVIIVGVAVASKPKSTNTANSSPITSTKTASTSTASSTSNTGGNYKDGTYAATGSYDSPGGIEKVGVQITLASNVVTAANVQSETQNPTAESYQSIFIMNYKKYVVGKKINDVKLSNVSGSSLTSKGFLSALKQIEHQAEA